MHKIQAKAIALILLMAVLFVAMPDVARAEEGNKFVSFLRKIITYPFRVTKEATEVVTETTVKGVDTVAKTGDAIAEVATGNLTEVPNLVVEPIKGSVETAITAVEGTVKIPIEAAIDETIVE